MLQILIWRERLGGVPTWVSRFSSFLSKNMLLINLFISTFFSGTTTCAFFFQEKEVEASRLLRETPRELSYILDINNFS